jgi:fumarylacetoacetase
MALKSRVASANDPVTDFPIQNLPYGAFRYRGQTHIGIAIGDRILDLFECAANGLIAQLPEEIEYACRMETLNDLMALGPLAWKQLRVRVTELLDADHAADATHAKVEAALAPAHEVEMQMPARIGDYTDFYASIDHATRVGKLFRPDNPLLPNYKYVPIGYHGRASSIVLSETGVRRPYGQTKTGDGVPVFGAAKSLDYELEVGMFVGPGNPLGESIAIDEAERHIFGLCLVNDWSARDMQAWEYQPLGPFLAKSFATTISPWIVPLEALEPYRVPVRERENGDPAPLAYLVSAAQERDAIDLTVEVYLETRVMRDAGIQPERISRGNLRDLYWGLTQLLTHHTSNGCNLRAGDLLATGTISGPDEGSEGCLLEMRHRTNRLRLGTGEQRTFLEDGDRVILRAYAQRAGLPRIGFGECAGMLIEARPATR